MTARRSKNKAAVTDAVTVDSFQNVNQRLGLGAGGPNDTAGYNFNYITRNRILLEAAYRTSWVVGKVCDAVAEDMTKAGILIDSTLDPRQQNMMYAAWRDLMIAQEMANGIRWGRLYGGAINVMMIDGQAMETPLNLDTIKPGQFRGLLTLDRWLAIADTNDIVSDFGPDFGLPRFYNVTSNPAMGIATMKIHYSRVLRHTGIPLPWFQRNQELLWGESIVERIWDRILAFDSTTTGAAQLVFKAHLRTVKVDGYRQLVAAGGKMFEAVMMQFENMRMFQNTEGLTVLDAADEFETHSYAFSGLDSILTEMGNQVCGAVEIPRVRLFGESPGGLNSNGESDLRQYYDDTNKNQESKLRRPTQLLLDVMCRSVLGMPAPEGFTFTFAPLWQMSSKDKADIAKTTVEAVGGAYSEGIITGKVAAEELRASARVTGIFSNISDEDIAGMEDQIPDPVEQQELLTNAKIPTGNADNPQGNPKNDPSQPGGVSDRAWLRDIYDR